MSDGNSDAKEKTVHLKLCEQDHRIFRVEAAKRGVSMQALLKELIEQFCKSLREKT